VSKTTNLDKIIQNKIKSLTPQVELLYREAKNIKISEGTTEFATQCASTIHAIVASAPGQDVDELKNSLVRLDKLNKLIDQAKLGKRETAALSASIVTVKDAIKTHIETKNDTIAKIEKIAETLASKAIETTGVLFDNDPLVNNVLAASASIGSYFTNKIKNAVKKSAENREEQRRQEREDLEGLEGKKTKSTRNSPSSDTPSEGNKNSARENSSATRPNTSNGSPNLDGTSVQVLKTMSTHLKSIAGHFIKQEAVEEAERVDKEEDRREGSPPLKRIDKNVKSCLDVLKEILEKDSSGDTSKNKAGIYETLKNSAMGVGGSLLGMYALIKTAKAAVGRVFGNAKSIPSANETGETTTLTQAEKSAEEKRKSRQTRRTKTRRRINRAKAKIPGMLAEPLASTPIRESLYTPEQRELEQGGRQKTYLERLLSRNPQTEATLRQRLMGNEPIPNKFSSFPKAPLMKGGFKMPSAMFGFNMLGWIVAGLGSYFEKKDKTAQKQSLDNYFDELEKKYPGIKAKIEAARKEETVLSRVNPSGSGMGPAQYDLSQSWQQILEKENKEIVSSIERLKEESKPKASLKNQEEQKEYLKSLNEKAKETNDQIKILNELYEKNLGLMEDLKEERGSSGFDSRDVRLASMNMSPGPQRIPDRGGPVDPKQMDTDGNFSGMPQIISVPGDRRPANKDGKHHGTDVHAPVGSNFYSIWDGEVVSKNAKNTGKGGYSLTIRKKDGTRLYIAHFMGPAIPNVGDKITKGMLLGKLGDSGNAKGGTPHLHIEDQNKTGKPAANWADGQKRKMFGQSEVEPAPENPTGRSFDLAKMSGGVAMNNVSYVDARTVHNNVSQGGGGGTGASQIVGGSGGGGYDTFVYNPRGAATARKTLESI